MHRTVNRRSVPAAYLAEHLTEHDHTLISLVATAAMAEKYQRCRPCDLAGFPNDARDSSASACDRKAPLDHSFDMNTVTVPFNCHH